MQYILELLPVAAPLAVAIVLIVVLTVIYLLARILFSVDTATGLSMGALYGIFIGIVTGLVCMYLYAGSFSKLFFGAISWMPFVYVWALTVLLCSIIGGIKKQYF